MRYVPVKLVRDAFGAKCNECSSDFNKNTECLWGWRKSQYLHEHGTGHKLTLYTLEFSK
jgi:hypothetical protein